ncbi:hypothetical protein FTV88_1397 [Heliorestis convoluta]|uniref:Uncharacterized protein n=1 Tax=Heliorestis convoluta TaxID=356322 RepID=A0A5Q2MXP4_9FIRM|nr:hypothetical protein FTV88_1397 [Heliorestis convoluta]
MTIHAGTGPSLLFFFRIQDTDTYLLSFVTTGEYIFHFK